MYFFTYFYVYAMETYKATRVVVKAKKTSGIRWTV